MSIVGSLTNSPTSCCEATSKCSDVTPYLTSSPQIPISSDFFAIIFRALHDQMPAFINKRLHPYIACRWLRSSGQNLIVLLWRPKMKGNHALGIENVLLLHLKSVDSNETLKELICIDLLFPSGNYCCVFISALFFVDCCGKAFHLEMCYINMFYLHSLQKHQHWVQRM